MKKYFLFLMLCLFGFFASATGVAVDVDAENVSVWFQFAIDNWVYILPIISWLVYRWIPTGKADIIYNLIKYIGDLILADRKKGGGKH